MSTVQAGTPTAICRPLLAWTPLKIRPICNPRPACDPLDFLGPAWRKAISGSTGVSVDVYHITSVGNACMGICRNLNLLYVHEVLTHVI